MLCSLPSGLRERRHTDHVAAEIILECQGKIRGRDPGGLHCLGRNVTTHSKGVTPDSTTRPTPSTCDSGVETWAFT